MGQGLVIILHAWSGCIGGLCAVQASASSVRKNAVVVVRVSMCSRLRSTAVDLEEKIKVASHKCSMIILPNAVYLCLLKPRGLENLNISKYAERPSWRLRKFSGGLLGFSSELVW